MPRAWRCDSILIETRNRQTLLDTTKYFGLVQRIYLNELPSLKQLDAEVGIFKLIVEPETTAIKEAKSLVERAPEHLDFVERVIFYQFKNLS